MRSICELDWVFFPPAPAQSVTFHTDAGDIKLEVFCEAVPRAAEVLSLVFFLLAFPFDIQTSFLSFFLSFFFRTFWPSVAVDTTMAASFTGCCSSSFQSVGRGGEIFSFGNGF